MGLHQGVGAKGYNDGHCQYMRLVTGSGVLVSCVGKETRYILFRTRARGRRSRVSLRLTGTIELSVSCGKLRERAYEY